MDVENDMHWALSKLSPLIIDLVKKKNNFKLFINFFSIYLIFFIKIYKIVLLKNIKNDIKLIYILLLK